MAIHHAIMKVAFIILFVLAALSAIRPLIAIPSESS